MNRSARHNKSFFAIVCFCLLSKKRRGNSVSSLEEDLYTPLGVCLVARVPTKVIHAVVSVQISGKNVNGVDAFFSALIIWKCLSDIFTYWLYADSVLSGRPTRLYHIKRLSMS